MCVYGGHEYQIYIQSHLEEVVNVSKKGYCLSMIAEIFMTEKTIMI